MAPVTPQDNDIDRMQGANITIRVALTAAALVAGLLFAVILALEYADAERDRELRQWQARLGLIADTRTNAVNLWLRDQFGALGALAENASVRLYMSELTTERGRTERLTEVFARSGYLRNLLTVLADREGFTGAPTGPDVAANVRRLGVAGMALLDSTGRAVAATAGMPAIAGGLRDFVTGAERGSPAHLDIHSGPAGRPSMAFLAPVFAAHGDRSPARQVGWALGVKNVGTELFPLLRQPGAPWASAEALLVRRDGAAVRYLSPTAGGREPLARRLAFDTPDLAAAYAIGHPGGFSRQHDYRGTTVLVAARNVDEASWTLLYKVDSAEALGPGEARLRDFLVGIALAVVVVLAAFVAVWRHGASKRAGAIASRYEALFRRHEAQSRFLGLISDLLLEIMALVFQYGSNISVARINHAERLNGDAELVAVAHTVGHFDLMFSVWSVTNKCAAADMIPTSSGRNIYGVLYSVPEHLISRELATPFGRKSLDAIEGEGKNYVRTVVKLAKTTGEELEAITYVVKSRRSGLETSAEYVQHIFDGLSEHAIPVEYCRYVRTQVLKNNPALESVIPKI